MTTRMGVATMERIEGAALDLFAAQGFAATGIRQIAQAAGVSLASIYHHVASKEQLLFGIQKACLSRLVNQAHEVRSSTPEPLVWLSGLVKQHVRMHVEESKICRVTDEELWALPDEMHGQIVDLRDSYEREWASCLRRGADAGVMVVAELSVTRLALLDLCTGPTRWFHIDGRLTVDDLVDTYAAMSLSLVGATATDN